jgi:hypothetical protein
MEVFVLWKYSMLFFHQLSDMCYLLFMQYSFIPAQMPMTAMAMCCYVRGRGSCGSLTI